MKVLVHIFIFIIACIFPILKFHLVHLNGNLIGDGLDNLLVLTILERNIINAKEFINNLNIESLYASNAFYPYQHTALFTEPMYFPSFLYAIVKYFTNNQSIAYNGLFLIASLVNFYSFYFLCRQLKFTNKNSTIGSLIFANGHYFAIQNIHLQNQFAFGFPLILAFSILFKNTKRNKFLFLIFLTLLLQFLSSNYYGLFLFYFFVLTVFFINFFNSKHKTFAKFIKFITSKSTLKLSIPAFAFLISVIGLYFNFFKYNFDLYPKRVIEENIVYSNTILSFITLPENLSNFPNLNLIGTTHTSAHLGYVPILILILICVFFRHLNRYQIFFLSFAILFYLFSLGPQIQIFEFNIPGPYSILYHFVPGFKNIRVPSRIFIVSWFFLALLLISSKELFSNRINKKIIISLYILIVLEFLFYSKISDFSAIPKQNFSFLNQLKPNSNVLFLNRKNGRLVFDSGSLPEWYFLNTQFHTPNGYSGITFPFQYYLINLLLHYQEKPIFYDYLYQLGITHIGIIDKNSKPTSIPRDTKLLPELFNLNKIFDDSENQITFYQINPQGLNHKIKFPNEKWKKISFNITDSSISNKKNNLSDHNLKTFWKSFSSGYQTSKDYLVFSLNKISQSRLKIRLHSGPFLERLPYGIIVTCDNKTKDIDLLPVDIEEFLKGPIYDSYQDIQLTDCKSNTIELRVKHTTPYAILMLSEIEFFQNINL
ncbi:hypothetical protein [Leptospira levettii]|uniref:hypothetical protein n=2 Tax=Leptospira levettii TaxID=2023178 RepID=UPI000F643165|nr:hypothetical protein [Leptospira levettii]